MQINLFGFNRKVALMALTLIIPMITYAQINIDNSLGKFKTNLQDLNTDGGTWTISDNGLTSVVTGDRFVFSSNKVKDFSYTADVIFNNRNDAAASLLIRGDKNLTTKNMYIANINGKSGVARLFKFQKNSALDLVSSKTIALPTDNKYHLEVTGIGKHIVFKINGELVVNTADYTFSSVYGQNDAFLEGYMGFLSWNANVTYQNAYVTEITPANTPQLTKLDLTSVDGVVEHNVVFKQDQYVFIAYVDNKTTKINLNFEKTNATAEVKVTNASNQEVSHLNLPLDEGKNTYTVTSKQGDATLIFRIVVIRRKNAESYYNEKYRDQYHWSVKEGWSNDPNGMVYYNGEYHLFHQFYTDTNWGPMHWGHCISKDLIHWEEQPIELYPDEYGTMFSGSAVVDETNTSGLFTETNGTKSLTGGLVALITADGNGERVILATSKDGKKWEKHEGVVKDWTEDPLNNGAFRDPKVFRYQNKWFMVIAGGSLRIYSSDNLIDWTVESTYSGLDTECPDLYRLQVTNVDGLPVYKWVLGRCGRYYKVGDFLSVNGKWTFVPDSQYSGYGTQNDGLMNFAKDSYAAQTYYMGKFDEPQRVVQVNWMNNGAYSGNVDDATNNTTFNGTFNLQLELSLFQTANGKYLLQQTPIKEYETLRDLTKSLSIKDQALDNEKKALDYQGDAYEIVAEFTPQAGVTEVGFNVRAGTDNYTRVGYNITEDKFYIDRSKSGIALNDFLETYSQKSLLTNDGKIQLHIFVDRASVELFANQYTISGAVQIFPKAFCDGVEVYAVGGKATADINLYPLKTIWTNKAPITKPTEVLTDPSSVSKYVGDDFTVKTAVYPYEISQDVVWQMPENDIVTMQTVGNVATFKALKVGSVKVKIFSSVDNTVYKELTVAIRENNFGTNLNWPNLPGEWHYDNTLLVGQSGTNAFVYSSNRTSEEKYKYEVDIDSNTGIVNLIFGSQTTDAYAGCYAVQLIAGKNQVRLFDFKNDYTFATVTSLAVSATGKNHVSIVRNGTVLSVDVNGVNTIYKDIASTGRIYQNGLFALGVCTGTAKFSNVNFSLKNISESKTLILPSDSKIQYMGRIDFTDTNKPLFAYPNVTIKAKFEGTSLNLLLKHYNGSDFADNYFVSIIDGKTPVKFKVTSAQEKYQIAKSLIDTIHTVELIKVTESYCGECQFLGFEVDSSKTLHIPDPMPTLKMEFIGNSITCGFGIEGGAQPASDNSYKSYAAVAARELKAQFHTTSYSGIGVVKGFPSFLMRTMYGRLIALLSYKPLPANNVWDITRFVPDVVVVALGTNDYNLGFGSGTISAATFNTGYKNLVSMMRTNYPNAHIICTNSPMITNTLLGDNVQKDVAEFNTAGDNNVHYFAFTPMKGGGYGGHPGVADGQTNGKELAVYIRSILGTSAIDQVKNNDEELTLYPNPARNSIHVKSSIKANNIEISDMSGKVIQKNSFSFPGEVTLDLSKLPQGIYIFSIIAENQIKLVRKITKL